MPRCPVCGEQLPWFDRKHVREKHTGFFHETRRWQLTVGLFIFLELGFCISLPLKQGH
ncbi:MAG: hypothetical protein ACE5R6_10305 [Candidatus Heimdallarchaeota archaeon]